MNLKPFLRIGDNLTIHLARPELATAIFEAIDGQRDYLRQWLPWVDHTKKVEDTENFIRESMGHNTNGTRLTTFIMAGDRLAGSLGVVNFNKENNSCEIGYWLHREMQGQGVMTKCCHRFIGHLFRTKNLNRIEIKVAVANAKSQAIPLRLGFTKEGTLRQGLYIYKTYHDLYIFSLLREDWNKMSAKQPEKLF